MTEKHCTSRTTNNTSGAWKNSVSNSNRHMFYIHAVNTSSKAFQCEPLFKLIEERFVSEGAEYVKKINGIYAFNVTDGPDNATERWIVDVKNGNGSVQRGSKGKADCTFTIKDKDLVDMISGKLQAQAAFFGGKLKVKGNMSMAMKLQQILPKHPIAKL